MHFFQIFIDLFQLFDSNYGIIVEKIIVNKLSL